MCRVLRLSNLFVFALECGPSFKDSTLWRRVRTAVVLAFTSKYSLALYELITARINLIYVGQEEFSVQDLRELLGAPDGKFLRA